MITSLCLHVYVSSLIKGLTKIKIEIESRLHCFGIFNNEDCSKPVIKEFIQT